MPHQAERQASTSSIEDDRKISGSWLSSAPAPAEQPLKKKAAAKKLERIERIGLLAGSSELDARNKDEREEMTTVIGILDDQAYRKYLPRPIAAIRDRLVWLLRKESPFHARHQAAVRRPWLDRYFVNTSLLGTHSFFLIFLPMVFWLGNARFGRGLVNVLAFGVYISSAMKDLFCVPRPYSPPVTRLTIGTHHLEYGFPSTHSTNSVSIAFYLYLWVRAFRQVPDVVADLDLGSLFDSVLWEIGLLYYTVSVVYGRFYAGMHSITDCITGSALGALISWVQFHYFDLYENFLMISGWTVLLTIIPIGLIMVSVHPQPMEDCPCFEDAIAFIAVSMGTSLGRWFGVRQGLQFIQDNPLHPRPALQRVLLNAERLLPPESPIAKVVEPVFDTLKHPLVNLSVPTMVKSTIVVVFGVVNILLLRVVVKTACKIILPPIFRFVAESIGFSMPRRHYTPASDYNNIPLADLTAVPSVIDLPSTIMVTDENGKTGEAKEGPGGLKSRSNGNRSIPSSPTSPLFLSGPNLPIPSRTPSPQPGRPQKRIQFTLGGDDLPVPLTQSKSHPEVIAPDEKIARKIVGDENVKHYDADVLTKVIVYMAIGFASSALIPAFFERIGLLS